MKLRIAFSLFLLLSLPAAAVEGSPAKYVGGTASGMGADVIGQLDTTSDTALIFKHPGAKLEIPYAAIQSSAYSEEVARHLGVLPAIAIGLIRMRQHRHFFRISYRDQNGVTQIVILEVPKHTVRVLQAVLDARGPRPSRRHRSCGCGSESGS